jgi:hypothetical protein
MILVFLILAQLTVTNILKSKLEKKEAYMNFANCFHRIVLSFVETMWEIEVNIVAGALPA